MVNRISVMATEWNIEVNLGQKSYFNTSMSILVPGASCEVKMPLTSGNTEAVCRSLVLEII